MIIKPLNKYDRFLYGTAMVLACSAVIAWLTPFDFLQAWLIIAMVELVIGFRKFLYMFAEENFND